MSKEALAHEEAVQKAAIAIADARGIAEQDRTFGMMSVFRADADAVLRSLTRLPDREEVARKLNEEFGSREWDAVPADRRELKILVSSYRGGKVAAYSIAEDSKEDFLIAADRIISLMEGRG